MQQKHQKLGVSAVCCDVHNMIKRLLSPENRKVMQGSAKQMLKVLLTHKGFNTEIISAPQEWCFSNNDIAICHVIMQQSVTSEKILTQMKIQIYSYQKINMNKYRNIFV